jgi:hypothetical protein
MKAGAPPFPARCTCTDDTLLSKNTQEQDAGGLAPIPRRRSSGPSKKEETLLEPQKK